MHPKSPQHTDIDGNCSRGQGNGVGKGGAGNVVSQLGVESDDFGIDKLHHSGMEDQIHNTKIGPQNLVEKPGNVAGKPQPADDESRLDPRRK